MRPTLLIAVDETLCVVAVNDPMLACIDRRADEVIGLPLAQALGESLADTAVTAYAALQSGRTIVRELSIAPEPGQPARTYEQHFLPLKAGGSMALACTLHEAVDESAIEAAMLEASDRERRRLGRDLHDTLGQELATTSMLLSGLDKRIHEAAPGLIPVMNEARAAVVQALESMRAIVRGLAPPGLEDGGLNGALERLAGRFAQDGGLGIRFAGSERLPPLPPGTAEQVYRFAQEAFANVVRHAGATAVDAGLSVTGAELVLTVADNGGGFEPETASAAGGMGLRIMRFRAQNLGGRCEVASSPGGTRVTLRVPLSAHVPRSR